MKATERAATMIEYGIFNDEGCIARGYFDRLEADREAAPDRLEDDSVAVYPMCDCGCERPQGECEDDE